MSMRWPRFDRLREEARRRRDQDRRRHALRRRRRGVASVRWMKRRSAGAAALMILGAVACEAKPPAPVAARSTTGFDWPVPEGWKHETIPFPLDFAPGL